MLVRVAAGEGVEVGVAVGVEVEVFVGVSVGDGVDVGVSVGVDVEEGVEVNVVVGMIVFDATGVLVAKNDKIKGFSRGSPTVKISASRTSPSNRDRPPVNQRPPALPGLSGAIRPSFNKTK